MQTYDCYSKVEMHESPKMRESPKMHDSPKIYLTTVLWNLTQNPYLVYTHTESLVELYAQNNEPQRYNNE